MRYISKLPFTNIYKEAHFQSEVISQIVYGETYKVLEKRINWAKIELDFDAYTGYVPNNIIESPFEGNLPIYDKLNRNEAIVRTLKQKQKLASFAHSMLGVPYVWGGRSTFGVDCSGFVQLCYKEIGIQIPRDAYQQAGLGIDITRDFEIFDLLFFQAHYEKKNKVTHVGIFWEDNQIIHASGKVRMDKLVEKNIHDGEKISHKWLGAQRVLRT